jgi:hypothetical protein
MFPVICVSSDEYEADGEYCLEGGSGDIHECLHLTSMGSGGGYRGKVYFTGNIRGGIGCVEVFFGHLRSMWRSISMMTRGGRM